jgi:hypothetical protein
MAGRGCIVLSSVLLVLSSLGCRRDAAAPPKGIAMPPKTIQQVQQEHTEEWMALPGVVGTAIGKDKGKLCILVFTASNTDQVRQQIPSTVDGYPVIVRYMGKVRSLDEP